MITPIIIERLKWKAYLIFMATNLAFVPVIYFLYPETSNLSLEEVDNIFSRGGNPVVVARSIQKELVLGIREGDVENSSGEGEKVMKKGDAVVEHVGH
jgi:hypothetical protein